jgi:hypothetical protein
MSGDMKTEASERASRVGTMLLSRVLITWAELLVVGFVGASLGGIASGPPQLIVYLGTILGSVAVVMYNVDRLVIDRIASTS